MNSFNGDNHKLQPTLVCVILYVHYDRFDAASGKWSEVAPLLSKRKHLGVAVHHNMIYAVGGRDQHAELNSVERSEVYAMSL